MAGPENTFIASVHRHMPPITELYRMKNHNQYNAGIADVWYSGKQDLWVEYKFITVPKRNDTVIELVGDYVTPLQDDWLASRHAEGRNVWVIVGSKEGGVVYQNTTWRQPTTAGEFRRHLRTRAELAATLTSFLTR